MKEEVEKALSQLKAEKTVLYPTDTVWGLGCDPFSKSAVKRIYDIKQREDSKSLILLVSDQEMLSYYVSILPEMKLYLVAERPTTIIYTTVHHLPEHIRAADGSVAIRVVRDPFCQALIQAFGKPIVSTSANPSGAPTAVTFAEIDQSILRQVDYIVNWRQEERETAMPSRILKVKPDNSIEIIRE